jgi:hypothetical protein
MWLAKAIPLRWVRLSGWQSGNSGRKQESMFPESSTHKMTIEFEVGGRLSNLMEKFFMTVETKLDALTLSVNAIATNVANSQAAVLAAIASVPGADTTVITAGITDLKAQVKALADVVGTEDSVPPTPPTVTTP